MNSVCLFTFLHQRIPKIFIFKTLSNNYNSIILFQICCPPKQCALDPSSEFTSRLAHAFRRDSPACRHLVNTNCKTSQSFRVAGASNPIPCYAYRSNNQQPLQKVLSKGSKKSPLHFDRFWPQALSGRQNCKQASLHSYQVIK